MLIKYSFRCNKCGKEFSVDGHWYNQAVMEHYLECRYLIHDLRHHWRKNMLTKKYVRYVFVCIILWIPVILWQIADIFLEPFRRMF